MNQSKKVVISLKGKFISIFMLYLLCFWNASYLPSTEIDTYLFFSPLQSIKIPILLDSHTWIWENMLSISFQMDKIFPNYVTKQIIRKTYAPKKMLFRENYRVWQTSFGFHFILESSMVKNLSLISLVCGIFKNNTNKLIYKTETDLQT